MPSNVVRRGSRWGARVTIAGKVRWLGTFDTEQQASDAVAGVLGGRRQAGTVAEWFAGWPLLAAARRPRSQETIARTLALAQPFVASFGSWRLESLSRGSCASWALAHPSHARYARTILADAVWAGRLDVSPLDGVMLETGGRSAGRELTAGDVVEIAGRLAVVDGRLGLLVMICAYSGLRLSEALALEAGDVQGRIVHVRCGKGGREGHAVMFPLALDAFVACSPSEGRLFPARWDRKYVHRRWKREVDALGLDARFHDLRHFHAVWLLEQGVSRADVAVQLRHAGLRDVDRYLATRVPAAALDRVAMMAGVEFQTMEDTA